MSNTRNFQILVKNNSGAPQNYFLFSEVPQIAGHFQGKAWPHVIASGDAGDSELTSFSLHRNYSAMCGYSEGTLADGVRAVAKDTKAVTLGYIDRDEKLVAGSTVQLAAIDQNLQFKGGVPDSAKAGSFGINTGTDFSFHDATQNYFIIGVAAWPDGEQMAPSVSFVPDPNVKYQIKPVNAVYITYGDLTVGAAVDVSQLSSACKVDFAKIPSLVTVIHDEHNVLSVEKP